MANYTKGEWGTAYHADNKYSVVVNPKGHPTICRLNETVPEASSNAHLIAAAPDMYEALKYIIRELDKANIIKADSVFMVTPQKALAKAEGK